MKLRNKKTGEIKDACEVLDMKQEDGVLYKYYSLAKLNAEWEDYEEPKDFYFYVVEQRGIVGSRFITGDEYVKKFKQIGNYFETKEEAEKAVEKLKAWKRLKDKGFKFTYWNGGAKQINFIISSIENECYIPRQICDDLELLFSGEDD